MKAVFEPVPLNWKRKPYFDYYHDTIKTKYNVNHHIDITELLEVTRQNGLKFYPVYLYVIMHVVNQNEAFRMSFDEKGRLGIWNYVVPSYTIFHDDDKSFSDIWSEYHPGFKDFYWQVIYDMEKYKDVRKIKARENQPANFCPVSVVPWLSFHSISQDTYSESNLLFPIIRFGKFYQENEKTILPFSVFVNHAVADGYHTAKLINEIEAFGKNINQWVKD